MTHSSQSHSSGIIKALLKCTKALLLLTDESVKLNITPKESDALERKHTSLNVKWISKTEQLSKTTASTQNQVLKYFTEKPVLGISGVSLRLMFRIIKGTIN